jgi:hypothetical protein
MASARVISKGFFDDGVAEKEELREKNKVTEHTRNAQESFLIIDMDLIIFP